MDAQEIKEVIQEQRDRSRSNKKKKMTPAVLDAKISWETRETMRKEEFPKRFANNVEKQERWINFNARKCGTIWSMDWNNPDGWERKRDRKLNRLALRNGCRPNNLSKN